MLIVTSATNPFSSYYTEILRAEGMNLFSTADIGRPETPDVGLTDDRPAAHAPVDRTDVEAGAGGGDREESAQTEEELTPSASDRDTAER